jgi:heat shock protein HtpX
MGAAARTALLMLVLTGILLAIGYAVGYFIGNVTLVLTIAFGFAMLLNIFTYWYADKWVLKLYKARLVTESEEPELHRMIERLASNAGLPKPRIAVIPTDTPNAFATGRNPSHAVVAVTDGARCVLDNDQLEAVLGHEIAHIKNRDMLINTMVAMVAGAIAYIGLIGRFSLFFGGGRDRGGAATWLALLAMILLPIAAMLIRLSVSRTREYGADRSGASISRKPRALASALLTIQSAVKSKPMRKGNPATSHMFIVNPFHGVSFRELFSTHPATEKRVRRLEEMAATGRF